MAERRKLIVVSNRGPVSYSRQNGERVAKRGGGGLVTALRGLVSYHDVTWIASAISDEDRVAADETIDETARDGSSFRLRLVAHDEAAYDWFYNVVANPMLWFLQHYLWELAYTPALDHGFRHAWEQGYVRVNEGFAAAVLEELEAEPDAAVLFHDYHLYLTPRLVREEAPDATLSHFVHIPWPQPDYWRVLPAGVRAPDPHGVLRDHGGRVPPWPVGGPARPLSPGHSGVFGVSRRDPARGASGQRPFPDRGLVSDRSADRGQLPTVGCCVQTVRCAVRERDLRRTQPRRKGGAARQHPRRCRCLIRKHRRLRRARGLDGRGQSVRRRRPGGGDPRGAAAEIGRAHV